jgi:hypothetical protein
VHHALDVVIRNGKALDGTIDTLITLLTMKLANTSVYELEVGQPLPGVCSLPTDDLKSFRYFVTPTRAHSGWQHGRRISSFDPGAASIRARQRDALHAPNHCCVAGGHSGGHMPDVFG